MRTAYKRSAYRRRRARRRRGGNGSKLPVILVLSIVAALVVALAVSLFKREAPDPHEGQVYINDGFGMVWMTPLEGVDVNPLTQADFRIINGNPHYTGEAYETARGIDVSEHQHGIEWDKVAEAGIDFAYVRLGYRGYTEGGIFEDPYFESNVEGALKNGLDVGVYFFSQAISVEEALEEAEFVLERIEKYNITLPVVFDWEKIEGDGRANSLDPAILNDCAIAFCEAVKTAGYEPAVYFNRYLGYYAYDLSKLTDYKFWLAVPGDFPDFYYETDIWQYTFTAEIPGIAEPTDLNLMLTPIVTEPPVEEAE